MKRGFLVFCLWMIGLVVPHCAFSRTNTTVTIVGEDFYINSQPTYARCVWRGHRIEGLLLNSRMVQATFDDRNTNTIARWAYPDTDAGTRNATRANSLRRCPAGGGTVCWQ